MRGSTLSARPLYDATFWGPKWLATNLQASCDESLRLLPPAVRGTGRPAGGSKPVTVPRFVGLGTRPPGSAFPSRPLGHLSAGVSYESVRPPMLLHGTSPPFRGHQLALGRNVPGAREITSGLRGHWAEVTRQGCCPGGSLKCHHCRFEIPAADFTSRPRTGQSLFQVKTTRSPGSRSSR
jgi:hypothetical protein